MLMQDVSHNRRLARLTQLTEDLTQSRSAEQTFETLEREFLEVDGFVASILLSTAGLPDGHYRVLRIRFHGGNGSTGDQSHSRVAGVRSGGVLAAIIAR